MTMDRFEVRGFCPGRMLRMMIREGRVEAFQEGFQLGHQGALDLCSESLEQMPPDATLDEVKELVQSIKDGEVIIPDPEPSGS